MRAAFEAEKQARASLPGDTRGVVVIMAEVAQGGLNQAVIAIEEVRGTLAAALDVQAQLKTDGRPGLTAPRSPGRGSHGARASAARPGRRPGAALHSALHGPGATSHPEHPRSRRPQRARRAARPPEDPVRADPRRHRPALGGRRRPARRPRHRRAGVHRRSWTSSTAGPAASCVPWLRSASCAPKRYGTALAAPGDLPAKRVLTVSGGDADGFDRETARRLAASALRRLVNREVRSMAVWLAPVAAGLGGDEALAAELVARGVVEGGVRAQDDLPRGQRCGAAGPRGARARRRGAAGDAARCAVPSAAGSSARARTSPAASPTAPPTTSPRRSSRTRLAPSPRRTACGSTSSTRSARPSWAWACSSPSARAATTRRG